MDSPSPEQETFDPPLPGPAEREGEARTEARFNRSSTLSLLNPLQASQIARQLWGEMRGHLRYGSELPAPGPYAQKVRYTLPFEGEWLVYNGGPTEETSHSWDLLGQRYAWDFVVADGDLRRHRGDGSRPEHYHAYGAPILAAADGEVVHVRDGVRDAPNVGTGWVDWRCRHFAGNAVTIRHHEDEYSLSAHLAPGSIRVRRGKRVERGQPIGLCGNSGHSTEPHLHFQVQDGPRFFGAVSLPVAFSSCLVDGARCDDPLHPVRAMRISPRDI